MQYDRRFEEEELERETENVTAVFDKSLTPQTSPKQGWFLTNLISNAVHFGFSVIVGLWYMRCLVHHLGAAAYRIIPLVTQITNYMIVVVSTLNSAVGSYMTIALKQNNDEEANSYFNTLLFGSLLLMSLLAALITIECIIEVPIGQENQTQWLFVCTVAGFFWGRCVSHFPTSPKDWSQASFPRAVGLPLRYKAFIA